MAAADTIRRPGAGIGGPAWGAGAAATSCAQAAPRELSKAAAGASAARLVIAARKGSPGCPTRHRFVAYELIRRHPGRPRASSSRGARAARPGDGVVGRRGLLLDLPLRARRGARGRVPDSLIHRWARSPDRWWRRAALVSTVPLNSGAGGAGTPADAQGLPHAGGRPGPHGREGALLGPARAGEARSRSRPGLPEGRRRRSRRSCCARSATSWRPA
jgi:hypothetical protein